MTKYSIPPSRLLTIAICVFCVVFARSAVSAHYLESINVNGLGAKGFGMCQGDCDKDSDCQDGLICFQREGYTPIPGCTGDGEKDWDYCVRPLASPNVNGKGQGGLAICEG